jgi:hypothetical protein
VSYPSLDADHTLYQCDSFAAIVKMTQHTYYSDWVSWKGDSGRYYVQVIDRSLRRKFEEEMSGRSRRRWRGEAGWWGGEVMRWWGAEKRWMGWEGEEEMFGKVRQSCWKVTES